AADGINDRASATHQRRGLVEHSRLDRGHARGIARLEAPLYFRMLAECAESGAWRVEENVLEARGRKRRGRSQVGAYELDIAMAQASRQASRVPKAIQIQVERDHASALADHLRQMRRLAAWRGRAIDDSGSGSGSQHARDQLRCFGLRMEETVAIGAR